MFLSNVIAKGIAIKQDLEIAAICKMGNILLSEKDKATPTPAPAAGSKGNVWDFATKEKTKGQTGAFDKLTTTVQDAGNSWVTLVQSLAISVAMSAIILLGMSLVTNKSGQKKQENKEHIPWVLLGIIFIIFFTVIFTIANSVGTAIETSLK